MLCGLCGRSCEGMDRLVCGDILCDGCMGGVADPVCPVCVCAVCSDPTPTSTSCGHRTCQACFMQLHVNDNRTTCPVCRRTLRYLYVSIYIYISYIFHSITLHNILFIRALVQFCYLLQLRTFESGEWHVTKVATAPDVRRRVHTAFFVYFFHQLP